MNIAYFLLPKHSVAYLYDDCTFRQGLEKMRHHGYTAIPVISREGTYIGTVSEGDFLWRLLSKDCEDLSAYSMKDMEKLRVRDILRGNNYPPVRITVSMEALLQSAMNQNFIPVVDDLGNFTGIVTRRTSSAILRSARTRRSRSLCGRSYKPAGGRRSAAPPSLLRSQACPSGAGFDRKTGETVQRIWWHLCVHSGIMVFIQTETEESILMRLGTSLYHARRKKGLSQEAVAEKLGVSRQTISKWETDETLPDIRQAKKLSVLYGLTLDELISFDLDTRALQEMINTTSDAVTKNVDWTRV